MMHDGDDDDDDDDVAWAILFIGFIDGLDCYQSVNS